MNILLTGASGYIGRRLLPILVQAGHTVYAVVRDPSRFEVPEPLQDKVTVCKADLLKIHSLKNLPKDIDAAYYLVHAMSQSSDGFKQLEERQALNFNSYTESTSCRQVIYLTGIANDDKELSEHLKSRLCTEDALRKGAVRVTALRAAIIIGSGSASFEIIRDLTEKLPFMLAPKWLNNRCQPIAIRDVIRYLQSVLIHPKAIGQVFDIGGPDIMTYKEMLLKYAKVRGIARTIVPVPYFSTRLSSYWLTFITSAPYRLARSLAESLHSEVVCKIEGIKKIDDHSCLSYEEALELALGKIEQNEVVSSWRESLMASSRRRLGDNFEAYMQVPSFGCLSDKQTMNFDCNRYEKVLDNIWQIGGERGWYYANYLWEIRGIMDKTVGGVGLRRGRRSPSRLRAGDSLDFWRVIVADRKKGRLLLYAEMKLPGEAWLEFKVKRNEKENTCTLTQTATFRPRGLAGRLYWYSILPLHYFIFRNMAKNIIEHD